MNLYGYAAGDPVNFGDPFGLKVCLNGDVTELRQLRDSLQSATSTRFDLDKDNCAANVRPIGDEFTATGAMFNELAADPDFTVAIELFDLLGSAYYPTGRTIEMRHKNNSSYDAMIGNRCVVGGARQTFGSTLIHELGHAWNDMHGRSGTAESLAVGGSMYWENLYHSAYNQRPRCAY